jgi:hypothetical protein
MLRATGAYLAAGVPVGTRKLVIGGGDWTLLSYDPTSGIDVPPNTPTSAVNVATFDAKGSTVDEGQLLQPHAMGMQGRFCAIANHGCATGWFSSLAGQAFSW